MTTKSSGLTQAGKSPKKHKKPGFWLKPGFSIRSAPHGRRE